MAQYEELLINTEENGIKVLEKDLGTNKKCGFCIDGKIVINNRVCEKEKGDILLEELGHYHTTFGNILDQTKLVNKKKELVARRWGYKHIVSLEALIEAFENNCLDRYEVAEYLGVTNEYFTECINEYEKMYSPYCILDKYIIYFTPTLGIYKKFG